jgi:hypothetical protein
MNIEYLKRALVGRKITSVDCEDGVFFFETDSHQMMSVEADEIVIDSVVVEPLDAPND